MTVNFTRTHAILVGVLVAALIFGVWAVSGNNRDPEWLREHYGITDAFSQKVDTPDGTITASLVPVNLADGRTAYLVVPQDHNKPIYLKDEAEVVPVQTTDRGVSKEQFVRSRPVIVERPTAQTQVAPAPEPTKKRSTKKEALIIAGGAGTGAAIGGIAGGKKGAAVGAVSGGVAGLIYDIATRNK